MPRRMDGLFVCPKGNLMKTYPEKSDGFYQYRVKEYGFSTQHTLLLRWFINFMVSGKMKKIRGPGGHDYYWLKYDYAFERNPLLKSARSVRRYLDDLCGNTKRKPNLTYPMRKHIVADATGVYTYFCIIPKGIAYLMADDSIPAEPESEINIVKENEMSTALLTQSMIAAHHTTKKKATHVPMDLKPKTREILDLLLQEGTPFGHRLNKPGTPATKTLLCIEKKLLSLYAGTFLKEYDLDKCWQRGKDLSVFDEMKGSWKTITKYLIEAATKYKKWEEKKTKSIDTWLFNPRTCKSTFLTAISMSKPDQDFAAEKILDQIAKNDPKSANVIAELLDKRNGWGNTYVCVESLRSVLQYLNQNWYSIQSNNKELWHYHRPAEILSNYGKFLLLQKSPDPKHMNITGYLWENFTNSFYSETEIDLEITA